MRVALLLQHLRMVALAYSVSVSSDYRWLIANRFLLPAGYNWSETRVLVGIPGDYPLTPPGLYPAGVFLPQGLRFRGRQLANLHPGYSPGWGDWAWLCLQRIEWNVHVDDLVRFLEMLRAGLVNAPVR